MLDIIPDLLEEEKKPEEDNLLEPFLQDYEIEEDIFGNKVHKISIYSLLRKMRTDRYVNLPVQKKHDVEIDDQLPASTSFDDAIKVVDSLQFPPKENIAMDFSNEGLLGKIYDDYEQRQEQVEMSFDILDAFADSKKLIIEAGTGVGKSMAYLIPAIKIAKENEIRVGVATKTNSLLDQLIYHELPELSKHINNLVYSSLKGAKHYICLRKVASLVNKPSKMVSFKGDQFCTAPSVAGLLVYIEQTCYDDCDGLKINGRALPNYKYTCGSHECLRNKCSFFRNGCFVHGARRIAKNSDIVVTNHSMLFCDIKSNNCLLPPIRY